MERRPGQSGPPLHFASGIAQGRDRMAKGSGHMATNHLNGWYKTSYHGDVEGRLLSLIS